MAPHLRFHGQPLSEPHAAGSFLRTAIAGPDARELSVAVAWARFGGLIRLADELRAFRERGGTSRLIVGIDEGVATRPGLALALSLFDEVAVLHDRGGRTFHPKLYLVEGATVTKMFVGSSNLTAAGLYFNFEASLEAEFSHPMDDDDEVLADVHTYLAALTSDTATRAITACSLDDLVDDKRYRIAATERRRTAPSPTVGVDPDEIEAATAEDSDGPDFKPSSIAATYPPPLSEQDRELLKSLEGSVDEDEASVASSRGAEAMTGGPPAGPADVAAARWSKKLNKTDAQHPPRADSNPTGNLRLSQADNPVDHRTWFSYDLFGGLSWVTGTDSRGNPIETATVAMEVFVVGSPLGLVDMRVDHAPHRESGQANVPTVLHWGSTLGPVLRATEHTGSTVAIERLATGSYRLSIA